MTDKMVVVCNGDTPANIMPALIFATSGVALDYEVHFFFCPAGARWSLKGELEKLGTPKGLPNPVDLFNTLIEMAPKVTLCKLGWKIRILIPKTAATSALWWNPCRPS